MVDTVQLHNWHKSHLGAVACSFLAIGKGDADLDWLDGTYVGKEVGVGGETHVGASVHEQVGMACEDSIGGWILTGDKSDRSPEGCDGVRVVREDMVCKWVRRGLVGIEGEEREIVEVMMDRKS